MPSKMEDFGFFLSRLFASTRPRGRQWPYVPGSYIVSDPDAPVAVCTLGSVALAPAVAQQPPPGLCITGKVETENIGLEKIIKNIVSNPRIRWLICCGDEPPKHLTGGTLLALFEHGMDAQHRIPGAPGMRPVLPNTTPAEVARFRAQLQPVPMIGCKDVAAICAKVRELADREPPPLNSRTPPVATPEIETEHVVAEGEDPQRIKLDKAGYFVIHVTGDRLLVEHYSYKERLLRVVEGRDARSIYLTLIRNGWVTRLDHAAYLGRQLARAEHCLRSGETFVQDGA